MRVAVEQEAALCAENPQVRQIHRNMASRYLALLDRVSSEEPQAA